jgi:hypothetical protein
VLSFWAKGRVFFFLGTETRETRPSPFYQSALEVMRAMNDAEGFCGPFDSWLFRSIHRNIKPWTKKREEVTALAARVWDAYIIGQYVETD